MNEQKAATTETKAVVNDGSIELSTLYYIIGTLLFVGAASLIFYYLIRKQSRKLQFVLILGRNGSGKTALFVQLTQDRSALTVSSLVKNIGWTKNLIPDEPGKEIQLIDVPGYERLRWDVFNMNKHLCKGIIFMVDSVSISSSVSKEAQEAADILYRVLTDPEIVKRKIPVLVVCNKQDQVAAKDVDVVMVLLEKEMNAIRITKYNPATKKGNRSEFIGNMEKDFEFAQLRNNKVTFVKSICKSSELAVTDDMKSVIEFLATLA
ncbi:hypothetical protein RvY_07382 [Ramazzottius varieornatus]|uniref:ADP-ribosylation factor-related protein 1 n=1 Tax=Ramazzottius varieornatus TaxID=947166 RepID=A0A1D1V832_RAMVA|nr:hypothetical protein RvY_07382 [Ramazzottius varieornatus]